MKTKKKSWIEQFQHVRYFSTSETKQHAPMSGTNGIRCEGDKLGYIVDWQVSEKRPIGVIR